MKFASPFAIDGNIDALISCLKLGNVHLHIDQTGLISLTGKWGLDAGPVYFNVDVGAAFDHGNFQVYGHGDGGVRGVLKGVVEAVLSNRALAACGSVDVTVPIVSDIVSVFTGSRTIHLAGGAAVEFKDGPPLSAVQILANLKLFTGCDIGRYYTLGRPNFARGAAAGSTSFRLAPKLGPTLISLEGTNRAPRVILHAPSGQTYDFSNATGATGQRLPSGQWGTVLDSENRTVVILPNPRGGIWTADVAAGSVPIVRVERAVILPPPARQGDRQERQAGAPLHGCQGAGSGSAVLRAGSRRAQAPWRDARRVRDDPVHGRRGALVPPPGARARLSELRAA